MDKIIVSQITGFISEMNKWEKFCDKLSNDKSDKSWVEKTKEMKEKAVEIFSMYCTERERKMSRPTTISWGSDGDYEYDPVKEAIVKVEDEKKKKLVFTERKDSGKEYRYTFLEEKGQWKIDSKKQKWDGEEEWENAYL